MGEAKRRKNQFRVDFIDHGRAAQHPANPDYPEGIDLDVTNGAPVQSCKLMLPYPAPRCGMFVINCLKCGLRAVATTAGRRDDPRSIRMPCKPQETT